MKSNLATLSMVLATFSLFSGSIAIAGSCPKVKSPKCDDPAEGFCSSQLACAVMIPEDGGCAGSGSPIGPCSTISTVTDCYMYDCTAVANPFGTCVQGAVISTARTTGYMDHYPCTETEVPQDTNDPTNTGA